MSNGRTSVVRKIFAERPAEDADLEMTLQEMQDFVGGYIEMVPTIVPHRSLIVNEEGALDDLPVNPAATALVKPGTLMIIGIRGDALMVKN